MEPRAGLVRVLKAANWVVAMLLAAFAVWSYVTTGTAVGLVILLAMIVVGPVEDILKARLPGDDAEARFRRQVVDQGTSLIMLLLLLYAAYLAVPLA